MIFFDSAQAMRLFLIQKGVQSYGLDIALNEHFTKEACTIGSVSLKQFLNNRFSELNCKEHFQWFDNEGKEIELRTRIVDIIVEEATEDNDPVFEYMYALECDSYNEKYFLYV